MVTLEPDSLLIANQLKFIAPAEDITLSGASGSERGAALEIKHVPTVTHTDFYSNQLVLEFANGKSETLNTVPSYIGNFHPYQTSNGTFFLAPDSGFTLPANAHSVPTTFHI